MNPEKYSGPSSYYSAIARLKKIKEFGEKMWGDQFNEAGRPTWWHESQVAGRAVGGDNGVITNGEDYFTLDPLIPNLFQKLEVTDDGRVQAHIPYYRSPDTGEVEVGERVMLLQPSQAA